MGSPLTPLMALLVQEAGPGLHEYKHALSSIDKYYHRLHDEMQDESVHGQIVLNPNRALRRLQKCFEILRIKNLPAPVSEKLFTSLVLPLIPPRDNSLTVMQCADLVGSALPLLIRHPSSPYLRQLARTLLPIAHLLDILFVHENYSKLLDTWLLSNRHSLDLDVVTQIVKRLIDLCDACTADHGIVTTSEDLEKATRLMESLRSLIRAAQEKKQMSQKIENLPPLDQMKALGLDDKKSHHVRQDSVPDIEIPATVLEDLRFFEIQTLASMRGLTDSLEQLENITIPSMMRAALKSFPCRPCMEGLTGETVALSRPADVQPYPTKDSGHSYDIFGKRVGLWKVLLTDTALTDARKLAHEGTFALVAKKLRELASGEWKGKDLSQRAGSKKQREIMHVPVLQVIVSQSVSILWQLDVGFYDELPWIQQQIVKVWKIVTANDELDTAIGNIVAFQNTYTPEFTKLCLARPVKHEDGKFLPQKFGNAKGSASAQTACIKSSKTDQAIVEMSNKFYNLTEPFLKSIAAATGREEFPFDLSPEELEVVGHFDTSSLILARSGTGKTTCLLFKILAKYRARKSASTGQPIRQLLLTRSAYLASKLRAYARSLIAAYSAGASTEDASGDSKPTSFFALKDVDFPFVCTYDDFIGLLENTIRRADRKDFLESTDKSKTADLILNKPRIIDFHIFKTEYWGCLSSIAPTPCSPELLFAEIMGVIKGSGTSAKTLKSLTRPEYVRRKAKASPAFAAETDREKVYAAFERYERQKKQLKEVDELDRVSDLLKLLKNNSTLEKLIRRGFEEIYIDEIQDLRCLDIVLILSCLSDARGIHLAGDTAQCISKDSAFRFPETKALFYEYYEVIAKELKQPSFAKPVQFSLAKNYRSHQGILSFASWVMQLLWSGFPDTIDKLEPEVGQTGGPRPIIFAGFDASILSAKMIGLVKLNDQVADFGAEQVILVRDDMSKDKLQGQIGEVALVLTILESKGMEFDDVLVYDLFGSSGLGSSYRCLSLLARGARAQFDSQKHAALCSELKHLYVAVTRARKQLWFIETSENSVEPVLQALSESDNSQLADLVKQKDPDALFCYKKANDPRGISHAQACLFEQEGRTCRAADDHEGLSACYEKAIVLFLQLELIPEAASCLEGLGQYGKVADLWKGQGDYRKAALYYEKACLFEDASECYHSKGEYEQAVEVLRRGDQFDQLIAYLTEYVPLKKILNASTLYRYSRLCNILVKQNRISADLRPAAINLLGPDVDKEAFFKEFEMFDQLRIFYEKQGRWLEIYEMSISAGDLTSAMDALLSHKLILTANKKTAETVFHYAVVESLFTFKSFANDWPGGDSTLLQIAKSTWLEKLAGQWQVVFEMIQWAADKNRPVDWKRLEDGIPRDFFCLYVIAFEANVVNKTKILFLPRDVILRAKSLIHGLEFESKIASNCLNLICGLFNNLQTTKPCTLLRWSPLKEAEEDAYFENASPGELFSNAKTWIRKKFAVALTQFHERAVALDSVTGQNVLYFMKNRLSIRAFQKSLLTPLYIQRVMGSEFQETFLKRRRQWLELVLEELTFISSHEQSASVIMSTFSTLHGSKHRQATVGCLEELLFHRLEREWQQRQSFTAILEQMQQARQLGFQVAHGLRRALLCNIRYSLSHPQQGVPIDPLKAAYQGFSGAETIYSGVARHNTREFYDGIREFLASMERVEMNSLTWFPALLSVVELATTYVLCLINPGNAVVIPWSWVLFHLPIAMQSSSASSVALTNSVKMSHLSCLTILVSSFCRLLDKMEFAIHTHQLGFMGRRRVPAAMIKRRNTDYLTTVALNLSHWPVIPKGFMDIWGQIQKVLHVLLDHACIEANKREQTLSFTAPPSLVTARGFQKLREESIRLYTVYNGKDELYVISLDNKSQPPLHFRGFVENHGRFEKLTTALRSSRPAGNPLAMFTGEGSTAVEEYSKHELDMITNLQRRWRRMMKLIGEKRRMRETTEGNIIVSLQRVCSLKFSSVPGHSRLSIKDKIHLRKLLFTDGLNILVELETMAANVQRLKDTCKVFFWNTFSLAEIEDLDTIRASINHVDAGLDALTAKWSLKWIGSVILIMSPRTLEQHAREAICALWTIKQEAEMVKHQLDAFACPSKPKRL
ncbi:Tetratricopeptide-like helical [Penicillium lagena]|uniref:Tetratricopeptide-like helical n=1 Tax=Penicillium lagena TaxID=94218 RepID=UPI00253F9ECB|nr:Tetratricopeptide-like helical [Penicillium lagena]KAJ5612695.1 Tetratricopeptide-like helical [Penicillium lagena]